MKKFKLLSILFLSVLIISCSKKDDGDDGGSAPEAEFEATINGGGFGSNYASRFGFYSTDYGNDSGLTLAITDENTNIVRIFLNSTGGFGSGITKIVGDVGPNGFVTNVIIRDQTNQVTYNSSDGEINITENKENPESEDGRLISGNFTITATSGAGPTITMNGNFKNFAY